MDLLSTIISSLQCLTVPFPWTLDQLRTPGRHWNIYHATTAFVVLLSSYITVVERDQVDHLQWHTRYDKKESTLSLFTASFFVPDRYHHVFGCWVCLLSALTCLLEKHVTSASRQPKRERQPLNSGTPVASRNIETFLVHFSFRTIL